VVNPPSAALMTVGMTSGPIGVPAFMVAYCAMKSDWLV
jgi:hypothetical protein